MRNSTSILQPQLFLLTTVDTHEMSESLFVTSVQLHDCISTFNAHLVRVQQLTDVWGPNASGSDDTIQHCIALFTWQPKIEQRLENFEAIGSHSCGRRHVDVPIAEAVAETRRLLANIKKVWDNGEFCDIARNRPSTEWEAAQEADAPRRLWDESKVICNDMPHCPDWFPHPLALNRLTKGLSDEPSPFVYEELPTATSIRLLKMLKAEESSEDVISVEMTSVDLEEKPEYAALSYTWGYPSLVSSSAQETREAFHKAVHILCNGKVVLVQRNLYQYLVNWRCALEEVEPSNSEHPLAPPATLWIDSLSINQRDANEKNAQVSMMGTIYKNCSRVIVWLGAADEFSQPAFDLLLHIPEALRIAEANQTPMTVSEKLKAYGMPDRHSWVWICLWAFLNRSWFRRAWVVQEVGLAPDGVQLRFGPYVVTWRLVIHTVIFLVKHGFKKIIEDMAVRELRGPAWKRQGPYKGLASEIVQVERPDEERSIHFSTEYGEAPIELFVTFLDSVRALPANDHDKLIRLFRIGRHAECQDPRDRIYAVRALALSAAFSSGNEDCRRGRIQVRYQDPISTVYLHAAWFILLSGDHLQLVGEAEVFEELEDDEIPDYHRELPSWVPNWSLNATRGQGPRLSRRAKDVSSGWKAANSMPWVPPADDPLLFTCRLPVMARLVDRVSEVSDTTSQLLNPLQLALKHIDPRGSSQSRNPVDELARVLFTDMWEDTCPLPDHHRHLFHYFLGQCFSDILCSACKENGDACCKDPGASHLTPAEKQIIHCSFTQYLSDESRQMSCADMSDHLDLFKKQVFGSRYRGHVRKVFRTQRGCLGSGTMLVKPGDEIFVVDGSPVPLILRAVTEGGTDYTFLCEIYVEGLMRGEAFGGGKATCMEYINLV